MNAKIIKFTYEINKHSCVSNTFIIQPEDRLSKKLIMNKIKSILTDNEGEFRLQSFSFAVSEATNYLSDGVSMQKLEENLKDKINWDEN